MNRLVIIGNGFDMAHGLKTSYKDFIEWYWAQRADSFKHNNTRVSEDCLCEITLKKGCQYNSWDLFSMIHTHHIYAIDNQGGLVPSGNYVFEIIKNNPDDFDCKCTKFFKTILQSIETRGWVDIEYDYYQLLKKCVANPKCDYTVENLNNQLAYIQKKLVEYLSILEICERRKDLEEKILDYFNPADFSVIDRKKAVDDIGLDITDILELKNKKEELKYLIPKRIMLLSFNYTNTARLYGNLSTSHNYIHGELTIPQDIIFGYGDELDKDYQDILDKNDNELLRNVKSVKYLDTGHYRDMLKFIQSAPFQVYIMGHSCGSSDRTLLNTIFEHENCVSIKPFYHKWDDGTDNYSELVQNISRNFTNMKLLRDRVVNKTQCETM